MSKERILETLLALLSLLTILSWQLKVMVGHIIVALLPILFLLFPKVGVKIALFWSFTVDVVGQLCTKIILAAVYFLFLFPLAFIRRIGNRDLLQTRKRPLQSLFKERRHTYTAEDFKKLW